MLPDAAAPRMPRDGERRRASAARRPGRPRRPSATPRTGAMRPPRLDRDRAAVL